MREFLIEYWEFIRTKRAYWMIPLMLVLLATMAFIFVAHGTAYMSFVYTFF